MEDQRLQTQSQTESAPLVDIGTDYYKDDDVQ